MGVGGGAHTGLIGEEAPGHAVAHGLLDADTNSAAQNGLGSESAHKDHAEGLGDGGDVGKNHDQCADEVAHRHDGYQLLGDGGNALHAAQEDEGRHHRQHHAGNQLGHMEGGVESTADGVGLDHVAHEAQSQDDSHGEEARQELAEAPLEPGPDVVHRAADDLPLVVAGLVLLGQHRLAVDGGHAEEGGQPHPEDGAGAAGEEGCTAAHNVAGAHLCGNGGGCGLEGAHTVLARLFAGEAEAAEHLPPAGAELPHLDEAQADGEEDAGKYQHVQQHAVPHEIAGCRNDIGQLIHNLFHG